MDLNKKSVKQQGGAMIPQQPGMQQQPQVDPQVMQITEVFSQSMGQGKEPQEIVMGLMEQQVDQNLIGQALMTMGYEQEMVVQLFKQIAESQRPQSPSPQEITNNPQQLARAEDMQEEAPAMNMNIDPIDMAKSGIEIKPENKGKFTAWAKSRGMSVKEAANKVMANSKRYPPSVVKMANFAKNAAGFKKQPGGAVEIQKLSDDGRNIITERDGMTILTDNPYDNQDVRSQLQDIETQIKLLEQQAAIAKAQAQANAKRALLNEQKEGGEFKPHFMYKGERKIRAKDMATHLRLKKAGYNHEAPKAQTGGEGMYDTPMSDRTPGAYAPKMYTGGNVPIGFNPDPKVQAELEKKFGNNPMANQLNDFLKLTENGKQNKLIDQKDNGYVAPNPMYFNPAMFGDMHVNVADIINTTASVGNDLFGKEGSISKFGKHRTEDKLRKLSNSTYDIEADLSPENQQAFQDYVTQFKYENPEKDILGNLVEESEKIASEISSENIDLKDPQILKFLKMSTKNMSKKGQELYDQLKLKFFPDGAPDVEVEETEEVTEEGTTNIKYGGSPFLPKAQFSVPDSGAPFANPMEEPTEDATETPTFQDWVVQDSVRRGGANAPQEYKAYIESIGNEEQRPEASTFPLPEPAGITSPTEWDKDGDGIPDMGIDIDMGDGTGEGFPGTAGSPSADELRSRINKPTVKRNRNPLAAAENMFNTAGAGLFAAISNGIYQGTRIANDIGDAKRARQAEYDLKTVDTIADNTYGVMTDMNFKRGKGELVNPGGFGSEGDRTTGLYMDTAKEGGGVNNAGFKALPAAVQQKILKSLQVGGGTGGTAAIDTARILKGLPYDFMSTSMGKQLLNVQPDTATDIMDVYSKAQNISSLSDGLDFFTSVSKKDIKNVMNESGIDKYTVRDYVKNQDFYNDASWATQQAIKLAMKTKGLKQGGETVNVDSRMLAKLIAAGADIEKL